MSATDFCQKCFGNGQWPEGAGFVTCSECHGVGEIVTDWAAYLDATDEHPSGTRDGAVAECPDCDGSGLVLAEAFAVPCRRCSEPNPFEGICDE